MAKYFNKKEAHRLRMMRMNSYSVLMGVLITALILLNLFTHVLQVVRYYGDGMEPTLTSGQTLVIHKTQKVRQGDVIAFYYNNQILVRRVICTENQQISIEQNGTVSVNGQVLSEPYVQTPSMGQCNLTVPHLVRSNHVFVMGDNRAVSMDSRLEEIGTIPEGRILGKVILHF